MTAAVQSDATGEESSDPQQSDEGTIFQSSMSAGRFVGQDVNPATPIIQDRLLSAQHNQDTTAMVTESSFSLRRSLFHEATESYLENIRSPPTVVDVSISSTEETIA